MTKKAAKTPPEFPKVLVRVRRNDDGVLAADIREAADAAAVSAAEAEGFAHVELQWSPYPDYPKWVYHGDGRRQIVATEDELTKLGDGWHDAPVQEAEPKAADTHPELAASHAGPPTNPHETAEAATRRRRE
jgi:hypothetical protein